MFIKKSLPIVFIILATILCSNIYSQAGGKIYTKEEADKLYGAVIESVELSKAQVESLLRQTSKVVMFKLVNKELTVLGDDRSLLSGVPSSFSNLDTFFAYSKEKLVELLKMGNSDTVYAERRAKKLTITNGAYTMQEAIICPPYCD